MDEFDFLRELIFGFLALAFLLVLKLAIPAFLFSANFFGLGVCFFDLALTEELYVFFLELFVHAALGQLLLLSIFLLLDLSIKFIFDQLAALLLSDHGLFLFLVVQQSVELLNGGPFVILSQLRVDFSLGSLA